MSLRLPLLLVLGLLLSACAGAPKKAQAPAGKQTQRTEAGRQAPRQARRTSPYAPAQEDPSKRGDYAAGGLYAPGVKDTVPDYIPDVDAIPEPEVVHLPRSRYGNRSPYQVLGKSYTVLDDHAGYVERGRASYYGNKFHGRRTSNQEVYDMYAFTAAHRSLPLPSFARVTNLENGKSVIVRVNDRGPFHSDRLIDLSYAAAVKLGYRESGTAQVEVRALLPGEETTLDRALAAGAVAATAPAPATVAMNTTAATVTTASTPPPVASTSPADATAPVAQGGDYRFDLRRDGRVMSADEFDAWMRERQVRIATGVPGKPVPRAVSTAATTTAAPTPAPAVAASRPRATGTGDAGVQLQVASFASADNAQRALARLLQAGVPGARLLDAVVDGRRIWRLRVGPLAEQEASPLALRIAGLGFGEPARVRE
ncbi:septal ring lytic transglycosylase RlpA family protein [Luteimonas sp. e5]